MKIVYASRTGNVESIINRLNLNNVLKIESGQEKIEEDFLLFTYTDGYGDIPMEVEDFLSLNGQHLKGVMVSGDQSYGEAYCQAGDQISEQYNVPCLYKVENDGQEEDIKNIAQIIQDYQ